MLVGIDVNVHKRIEFGLSTEKVDSEAAIGKFPKVNVAGNRTGQRRELLSYVRHSLGQLVPSFLVTEVDDLHYLIEETIKIADSGVDLGGQIKVEVSVDAKEADGIE